MSGYTNTLSVMVLTEDSGAGAYDTVRALVKEMFKLLVPAVWTHRIDFKPLEDESARRAMHANLWKSNNPLDERNRRLLIRSIITELLKPHGFVLYHIDGDKPWSRHESSENVREFLTRMRSPIEAGVRSQLPAEVETRMKRLRLLVPFYSIEAWLYQHTREAWQLCAEEGCGRCHTQLGDWEKNRASLDEVTQPKETTLCLKDKHNARLASSGFPARQVYEAEASFTGAVDGLLECDELTAALERTCATSFTPSP
ncbi:hypothetical protein CYFUS_009759 [Cystobacter fuscus]|uniref:DUF4276 family protein n=1 Tax=Cystobacter fuscus TaxID=43 RepID=A0A250JLC4_9BACT|nr:hypothetical protein [Cystobacter fuscus]ATB44272.1 hypothetical protein CYFUS_009759 [Cystobacter fuscus]